MGAGATLLALSFGLLAAFCSAGLPRGLRKCVFGLAIGALALPPFLVANCWLHFLGHTGVWRGWLPFDIFSLPGTIWILSLLLWPISFFFVSGALRQLESNQIESDMEVTGRNFLRALLFPLSKTALGQAAVLTFALALNNFAVPAVLQVKVFPAEMWVSFNTSFDTLGTLKLCWPLVLAPLLILACFAQQDIPWPHWEESVAPRLFRQQLGWAWFGLSSVCAAVVCSLSVGLPLLQILSVRRTWVELPGALAAGQSAIWNSFWFAAASATTVIAIAGLWALKAATPSALTWRSERIKGVVGNLLRSLLWLPLLFPGVLLGIALTFLFNRPSFAMFYQSAGIVALALSLRYFALGRATLVQAAQTVDRDLINIARLEGATRWQMFRYVHWPQISPRICAAWYVIFLLGLWDVESLILLIPPGCETLALRVFNLLHYGHNAQVNALCLTLLVVALMPWLVWQACSVFRDPSICETRRPILISLLIIGAGSFVTGCSPRASSGTSKIPSHIFSRVDIIGSRGVGVGQLNKPRSVAVDSQDNLYVVDMTGRVQKFSSNGVFQLSWQMPQTDLGKPKGMCRDREGSIIVVEPHYSRVNHFSPAGKLLLQWGERGTNSGQLSLPRAVAVNSHNEIFVSEYQESERVQKFELNETGSAPRWSACFGKAGTSPGEFNRPEGLCVDAQDRLYVADSCNHRIQILSRDGKFIQTYGKAGKGLGELSYPYDICVDAAGRQYVCEFGNSRIQVFDANHQPIEIIGGSGAEPGQFSNPWGVALDSAGNLYVADSQNHRVQKFIRKAGDRRQEPGHRSQEPQAKKEQPENRALNPGFDSPTTLDFGLSALDFGPWTLD